MQKTQTGFTLIELVVVIVLLGILGVTALGKFQDLSTGAQTAANSGVASELSSASSINYAARLLSTNPAGSVGLTVDNIDCSTALTGLFASGSNPSGYAITNSVVGNGDCATNGPGSTFSCNVVASGTPAGDIALANILCTP